jgi:hypothetical protein
METLCIRFESRNIGLEYLDLSDTGAPTVYGIIVSPCQGNAHGFRVDNPGRCPGLSCLGPFRAERRWCRPSYFGPKGQSHTSPGQRPGGPKHCKTPPCKGRTSAIVRRRQNRLAHLSDTAINDAGVQKLKAARPGLIVRR